MKQMDFDFDGDTFDPKWDSNRLGAQFRAVHAFLSANMGRYFTLREIHDEGQIRGSGAAISARFRDLRKPKGGMHLMDARRRAGAPKGVWEVAMLGGPGTGAPKMRHCRCCPNYRSGDE